MIDLELDEVLDPQRPLTKEELAHIFSVNFEWCQEHYLVAGIKKHLRTKKHKALMEKHDFSIEDMLNGRIEGNTAQFIASEIFEDWNKQIGHTYFHG